MTDITPEPTEPTIACPFCSARAAELVALFGSQLLLSQYRCTMCKSYFEGVREDRRADTTSIPEA